MKLHFIGADHEVTGSLHLLDACGLKIAVDVGMEQGQNPYKNAELPIKYSDIDYILLTHAHIDHAGMIPLAYKNGFSGTVLCTKATKALSEIMLLDSAHIQVMEAEYKNRKAKRAGRELVEPVYDLNDASGALSCFRGVDYNELIELADGVSVRFIDAGHLLGSSSIEVFLYENDIQKKIVFSGDIGNDDKPLIRNPQYIREADYVVMESTYGNRFHQEDIDHTADLVRIIQQALDRGGNVIMPAFSVGRTQELLYLIRKIKNENLIKGHDGFPVYVDSPLAVEATEVFKRNLIDCYDDETKALIDECMNPISFKGLALSITSEDSKAINFIEEPKVIISASGMCDAGRIRHHLKHNLWRPECSIVFAGYQAEGTLGRVLLDGAPTVKIFGEEIEVKAHIETMADMSSHADQTGLLKWISAYEKAPSAVFLVHGDDEAMAELTLQIKNKTGFNAESPYSGSVFNIAENKWEVIASPVVNAKADYKKERKSKAYEKLIAAYEKLLIAVKANREGANKDLAKFTDQILNLHDKWIR